MILAEVQISRASAECSDVTGEELAAITSLGVVEDYSKPAVDRADFSGLTALSSLEFSMSPKLTSIPARAFSELPALTFLFISESGVETIHENAFSGLANLEELSLAENSISVLPRDVFDGQRELIVVYLDDNNIRVIPNGLFAGPAALERINLARNDIRVIQEEAFSGLTNLTELNLSTNDLTTLPGGVFEGLDNLEKLWLAENKLTALPKDIFKDISRLLDLYLNGNPQLTELDEDIFQGLQALERLFLHDSGLESLPEGIFDELTGLRALYLSNNAIASLDEGIFSGLTGLTFLNLSANELESLPAEIFDPFGQELASLYLSNNRISALDEDIFVGLAGLTALLLNGNELSALPTDLFDPLDDSLSYLYLYDNQISALHEDIFDGLTGLLRLYLNGNELSSLPTDLFDPLDDSLSYLYLYDNQISALDVAIFDGLTGLSNLRLNGNDLSTLNQDIFNGLTGLQTLYLARNDIATLDADIFDPLGPGLTRLSLGSNDLMTLPAGIFDGLAGLTALDLSCNALTSLELNRFSPFASSLVSLDLSGNQFAVQPTDANIRATLSNLQTLGLGANADCVLPNNALLRSLSVRGVALDPLFDSATRNYMLQIASNTQEVTINYAASDPLAKVSLASTGGLVVKDADPNSPGLQFDFTAEGVEYIDGFTEVPKEFIEYRFIINIVSEDGSVTTSYILDFVRIPTIMEVRLFDLALENIPLDPDFDIETRNYNARVDETMVRTTVMAVPLDPDASIETFVDGDRAPDGVIDLELGWNDISVIVTSSDGSTAGTYRVLVLRGAVPPPRPKKILRIEPEISGIVVSPGDSVNLAVSIYGRQNLLDNDLAVGRTITWDDGDAGGVLVGGGAEINYTSPENPGRYAVNVAVAEEDCFGDASQCSAQFEITVRRLSAGQQATAAPVDPVGLIPEILVDAGGVAYEVLTPVDGGRYVGDGFGLTAPPGAVPNGEFIGISILKGEPASNVGQMHHRFVLGGSWHHVDVVDDQRTPITGYRLNRPAEVCVPLPPELRSRIDGVVIVASRDDSFAVLTSVVRLGSRGEIQICGSISKLPARIAAAREGAPPQLPTPVPVAADQSLPETGGQPPNSPLLALLAIVGAAWVMAGTYFALLGKRKPS